MPKLNKFLSLILSFCLILEQSVFAQSIDLSHYFVHNPSQAIPQSDKFRPLHLRYLGYDNLNQDFKLLLDKGDTKKEDLENKTYIEENTQTLLKYFFIGLSLPNDKFWVNLRPDSPDNILDPDLEKTDIGRIFLEADLQLKKDTSSMTSPQNPEGKAYWDKLYKKAGELFGTENITIPTITRPWIVPNEIIIREAPDNAYIYKATLKVMLEEDYLTGRGGSRTAPTYQQYAFSDPRLKELNEYSTQVIKETIIPKLTYAVNTAKRYAQLRQVYYSLILAQWFKHKYGSPGSIRAAGISAPVNSYIDLIDSGNLTNLTSIQPYDKQVYFRQYQESFKDGEYNLQDTVYTPMGQSIRRYVSGGVTIMECSSPIKVGAIPAQSDFLPVSDYILSAKENNPVNIAVDSEISGFIRKLQNLIEYAQAVEHKQVLMVLLEKLQRSPPEFERAISRIIKREFKISDLNGDIDVLYYAQGSSKIVYKVTFHASKENFDILVIFKKESGNGRIQPNEIADLMKLSTSKIKDLKLVPIFGFSSDTKNGRISFLEEFIEGKIVLEYTKENPLSEGLRNKIVATLFSIGILLGNVFPKDVNEGNFIITPEEEVVMVDIGNKRFSMGEALKYKNYNSMVEFLFLISLHYGRGEKDAFLAKAFLESLDAIEKFMKRNNIHNIRPGKTIIEARKEILDFLKTTRDYFANISGAEMDGLKKKLTRGNPYLYSYFRLHNIPEKEQEAFVGKYLLYIKDSLSVSVSSAGDGDSIEKVASRLIKGMPSDIKEMKFCAYIVFWLKQELVKKGFSPKMYYFTDIDHDFGSENYRHYFLKEGNYILDPAIDFNKRVKNDFYDENGKSGIYLFREENNLLNGVYGDAEPLSGEEVKILHNGFIAKIASSAIKQNKDELGGIAFNSLPIQTESIASSALGALPGGRSFKGDLDVEWGRIQDVFSAGIRPSIQRLSEYAVAAVTSPLAEGKIDQVRVMIADILRRDEESQKLTPAEESCKQLLRTLESA